MSASAPAVYACFLDGQPDALVPGRARFLGAPDDPTALVVSPHATFLPHGALAGARFLGGIPVLRVGDAATGAALPYWVANAAWRDALWALTSGAAGAADLPPDLARVLFHAGVLASPAAEARRAAAWQQAIAAATRHIEVHRYAVLRGVLHPFQVAALRRYVRALHDEGALVPDPAGSTRDGAGRPRLFGGEDAVVRYFHEQLTPLVRRIVGEPLHDTYGYLAHYPPGSSLPRHRDVAHCQWTMSLALDHSPGVPPLCFESGPRAKRVGVPLDMGDAVLYYGEELTHLRDALPAGHFVTPLLLCFARVDHRARTYGPSRRARGA